jgi:glycosyltransferase involved in cell wall biosynthesis
MKRLIHITLALCIASIGLVKICTLKADQRSDVAIKLSPEQKKALLERPKKIIGLVPVRNEEAYIDQCLRALALYTDAIIVLDDASTDNTVAIVESLAQECHIDRIIKKAVWKRDEPGDRNKLIQAGREIGGTHFIVLDADEMFTASCLKNNFLRNKILALEPGDWLRLHWIRLWKSINQVRFETNPEKRIFCDIRPFIFCDDGVSEYRSNFIHTSRFPTTLTEGKDITITPVETYGVLHFQAVNWRNMRVRQAWYRCIEHIRSPEKTVERINREYAAYESDNNCQLVSCSSAWFEYPFFDRTAYEAPEQWREKEILSWFTQYGMKFFADLDIWEIDWGAGVKKNLKKQE